MNEILESLFRRKKGKRKKKLFAPSSSPTGVDEGFEIWDF